MSEAVQTYLPRQFTITSLDGKKFDITNSILSIDYFEDILDHSVSMMVECINKYSIVSNLKIRGGEKVEVEVDTGFGEFKFLTEEDSFRVYKVSGLDSTSLAERFTLHLTTKEFLNNEISRSFRKHTGKISQSVKNILTNDLKTTKFLDENIEESANAYKFFGSMRKPFTVLQWLGPKTLSSRGGELDAEPNASRNEEGKGTMGFFFYENKEGFNFKSIDKLTELIGSAREENIFRYNYTGKVIKSSEFDNRFKIIDYSFDRNIDMRASLRFGTFKNSTFLFNVEDNEVTVYNYNIKDQIKNKKMTRQDGLSVPEELSSQSSRILVRTTDNGIMSNAGGTENSGRISSDFSKSAARYNFLFTQALNILIPCNVNLKVGDVLNCEFSEMDSGRSDEPDKEISGRYLIRELRHHFSATQNTTSLKLMRDTYEYEGN